MGTGQINETRLERITFRLLVAVVAAGLLGTLGFILVTRGWSGVAALASFAGASLLLVGKFVVFAGTHEDSALSVWQLAGLVWTLDLAFSVTLAGGLERLERTPRLAKFLGQARLRATRLLAEYPRLERAAFLGVATLVLLPLAATGAVTGSFAARLLGLSRAAGVAAIALGSLGTSLAFALSAHFLGERAADLLRSPLVAGLSFLILATVAWVLYRRILERLRRPGVARERVSGR